MKMKVNLERVWSAVGLAAYCLPVWLIWILCGFNAARANEVIWRCPDFTVLNCRKMPAMCMSFRMIYIRHGEMECPGCLICADPILTVFKWPRVPSQNITPSTTTPEVVTTTQTTPAVNMKRKKKRKMKERERKRRERRKYKKQQKRERKERKRKIKKIKKLRRRHEKKCNEIVHDHLYHDIS